MQIIAGTVTISHQPRLKKRSTRAASGAHNRWQSKYVYLIGAKMWMPVRRDTSTFGFGHESQTVLYLPVYTVNKVKNVTFSEQANDEKLAVPSCMEGPAAPDFELPIQLVVNTMKKISGRSWCLLEFCQPQCGQKIRRLQL